MPQHFEKQLRIISDEYNVHQKGYKKRLFISLCFSLFGSILCCASGYAILEGEKFNFRPSTSHSKMLFVVAFLSTGLCAGGGFAMIYINRIQREYEKGILQKLKNLQESCHEAETDKKLEIEHVFAIMKANDWNMFNPLIMVQTLVKLTCGLFFCFGMEKGFKILSKILKKFGDFLDFFGEDAVDLLNSVKEDLDGGNTVSNDNYENARKKAVQIATSACHYEYTKRYVSK